MPFGFIKTKVRYLTLNNDPTASGITSFKLENKILASVLKTLAEKSGMLPAEQSSGSRKRFWIKRSRRPHAPLRTGFKVRVDCSVTLGTQVRKRTRLFLTALS